MRVGIYGGTFDPPHLGHMRAAQAALSQLALDQLLLIPTGRPPHKGMPANAPDPNHRMAMTELMVDGMGDSRVAVSGIELVRTGRSYTVDTLRQIQKAQPGDELFLLMGTDMFLSFQDWHAPEAIAELATLAPFSRTQGDEAALSAHAAELKRSLGVKTQIVDLPQITELSSTQVRVALAADGGAELLWLPVYGYILYHGLYGVKRDLRHLSDDDLRAVSWSMVKAKRLAHIKGCEEEAVRLARRWGEDEREARRAGILHDCTKYLNLEEQKQLCARYGIELDELEREAVKLLHSKTGAAIAKHVFGESDKVYEAIFYHTTGRANMSLLEKILYIADYIEPMRDFPEVDQMRRLAYENLDGAVAMGAALAIEEMKGKNRIVHPNTLECYDSLTGETL